MFVVNLRFKAVLNFYFMGRLFNAENSLFRQEVIRSSAKFTYYALLLLYFHQSSVVNACKEFRLY